MNEFARIAAAIHHEPDKSANYNSKETHISTQTSFAQTTIYNQPIHAFTQSAKPTTMSPMKILFIVILLLTILVSIASSYLAGLHKEEDYDDILFKIINQC